MPVLIAVPVLLAAQFLGFAAPARAATVTEHQFHSAPLSPAELRSCLSQREHIEQAERALDVQRGALQQERTEIDRLSEALDVQLGALHRRSGSAEVAAFQAEMMERDQRVIAHVDRLAAFHARVEAVKAEEVAWTARCSGRPDDAVGEPRPFLQER